MKIMYLEHLHSRKHRKKGYQLVSGLFEKKITHRKEKSMWQMVILIGHVTNISLVNSSLPFVVKYTMNIKLILVNGYLVSIIIFSSYKTVLSYFIVRCE